MFRKNLFKKLGVLAMIGILSASAVGCGNVKEKSAVTPKSSVSESSATSEESVSSAKTVLTEKDISPFVKGLDNLTVEEGTKDFDPLASVTTDKNIIKGINADTSNADLDKAGEYTITYNVVVDNNGYEAYKKDVSSYKEDFAKTTSLTEVDADATSVTIEKNLTVTAKDNKATETKTDSKTTTATKTDTAKTTDSSTTSKGNTSTTTSGTSGTTSTTKQNTGSSGTTTQNTGTSGTTTSTTPVHTHNWVAQTKTVHHEAEYTTQWVQDTAAWDEPVYEEQPVYENVEKVKCNGCGAEFDRIEEMDDHVWYYVDNFDDFSHGSYSLVWRNIQTGTQKVQTGTIHHDATGHNEQVLVKAAWDETITTGYKCSGCGATK